MGAATPPGTPFQFIYDPATPLPLPAGTRLGPYEIVSLLGSGGMGEVHRARDTRPAMAYNSTTPEGDEIFLQPFPGPGDPIPVSVGGGRQAKWRADGRELFYLAPDGTMMAVDIATSPSFRIGRPKPLFRTRLTTPANTLDQYAVTRDGQRFLILEPDTAVEPESLTVMTNWTNLLRK